MKKTNILVVFALFSILPLVLNAAKTKKLLFIGTDGTRYDAIQAANAPFIKSLLPTSTYALDARTTMVTSSAPSWTSMCTGVWGTKHNVINNSNDFGPNNFTQYPDFFTYLERSNPALVTASFCNWGPLNTNLYHSDYKVTTSPYSDALTTLNAVTYLQNNNPDVVLVDLDEMDHVGHSSGFSPTNPNYIAHIEILDRQVDSLVTAVRNRANYANEDWLIMLTTDHGGTPSGSHGGGSEGERKVFIIANGGTATPGKQIVNNSTITYDVAKSLRFKGVAGEYLKATNKVAFNFGTSQDFTIELKVKVNSVTGDPVIIGNKNWNSGINKGFAVTFSGNTWKLNLGDGINRVDIAGCEINDNKWHQISISVERQKNITTFQDGVYVGVLPIGTLGDISSGLELALGQDGTTNYGSYFDGSLSDVRIWNKALSAGVIKQWFNQPITASHPDYSALNAYWKLDEGTGTTMTDSKGTNSLLYTGNGIQWNQLTSSVTPTMANAVNIIDNTATVLDYFGVYPDNLDGKSLLPPSSNIVAPVANFTSNTTTINKTNYVVYTNTTVKTGLTQYSWTFEGGIPSTSELANPVVKYNTPGTYQVSLTVTNGVGTDTKTIANYITVTDNAISNNGLNFDGVDDFVTIPETVDNAIATNDFTLEFWMNPANLTQNDPSIISNKNWGSGAGIGWVLAQLGTTCKFNIGNGTTRFDITFPTPAANVWSHVALVVTRVTGISVYVNGIAQTLTISSSNKLLSAVTGSVATSLGLKLGQDGTGAYSKFWAGKLDELSIWNTARTYQNIGDNSMGIANPQNEANLVAYYKFDQTTSPILVDEKTGAFSGSLVSNMNPISWVATGVRDVFAPTTPQNLSITERAKLSISLKWSAATDNTSVTAYKVYNGTNFVTTTSDLTYKVTGLETMTQYTFNVSAIDAIGNESSKATITASTTAGEVITTIKNAEIDGISIYSSTKNVVVNNKTTGSFTYELFNSLGKTIKTGKLADGLNSISVNNTGIVMLKITNGNLVSTKKIVIE